MRFFDAKIAFRFRESFPKGKAILSLVRVELLIVEVERGLLRNNGLTFSLIKNEYIYTNLKHKNRKQSTQNTKIGNNLKIRGLQQK